MKIEEVSSDSENTTPVSNATQKNSEEEKERLNRLGEQEEQAKLPYKWTQTLNEVDINVPLPDGTKSSDLKVEISKTHIKVALKSSLDSPIIDGDLHKPIKTSETTWTVSNKNLLNINVEKLADQEWWACVIKGHPEIDTTKIVPETSRLEDLNDETRALVEKMMYDQKQKTAGKPTSDEQNKMEMLKKFQQQHPEMDFSNAKFN